MKVMQRLTGRAKASQLAWTSLRAYSSVQTKKLDVTPATLRDSANRMLDAYPVSAEGSIADCKDTSHYCKLPNALACMGRMDDCDRMLDYCVRNFFCENGDFMNEKSFNAFSPTKKTLHWEFADFYPYLNQLEIFNDKS